MSSIFLVLDLRSQEGVRPGIFWERDCNAKTESTLCLHGTQCTRIFGGGSGVHVECTLYRILATGQRV